MVPCICLGAGSRKKAEKPLNSIKRSWKKEPSYVEKALEIIKSHGGRITQKSCAKNCYISQEAKVSLIVTELEHKELVEKIKKVRGNVILLKEGPLKDNS